ncbi:MAG: hypothetical protein FGM38_06915 [Solirubrobacterales bacterium]|nr:hypothetical protein [Solirubrobacterales bacterium]
MAANLEELPFIDRHSVEVEAGPQATWDALVGVLVSTLGSRGSKLAARALGCTERGEPDRPLAQGASIPGFRVVTFAPTTELTLAGEDRFSRYRLGFSLEQATTGRTTLSAATNAAFPGLHGRLFRTLVVGSGAHALVTGRLLKTVGRAAETEDRG